MVKIEVFAPSDDDDRIARARRLMEAVFCKEQGISYELTFGEDGTDSFLYCLAFDGREAVGTARARITDPGSAKIERMAVLEAYRGQGTGKAMLEALTGKLDEGGFSLLSLHAQAGARDFYRKCGFAESGEVFEEAGLPHVKMVRHLQVKTNGY